MNWDNQEQPGFFKSLSGLLTHNFWLKVLSIVFALILFLSVRNEQVKEYTKVAKVKIITNDKMMVIGSPERAVYVTVKLPNSLFLKPPEERELIGELDVRNEHVGKVRVRLSPENFSGLDKDKRYTLIIHDPWIEIDLDYLVTKELDVRIPIEGRSKPGFNVDKIKVNPEKVTVTGAKRELQKIAIMSTSVINIEGIDKSFSSRSKLIIDENSSLKLKDEWVNVQIDISPEKMIRTFQSIPVEVIGGKAGEIRPTHVDIELAGENAVLNSISSSQVRVFVDVKNLRSGWQEKTLRLQTPRDTSLVRVVPSSVSVRVSK